MLKVSWTFSPAVTKTVQAVKTMNSPPSEDKKRGKEFSKYLKPVEMITHHELMCFEDRMQDSVTKKSYNSNFSRKLELVGSIDFFPTDWSKSYIL